MPPVPVIGAAFVLTWVAETAEIDSEISVRKAPILIALFGLRVLPFFGTYEGLLLFSAVYVVLGAEVPSVR